MEQTPLDRLCATHGIANEYHDIRGNLHRVPDDARRRLLQAMGVDAREGVDIECILTVVEADRWRRRLEPVAIVLGGDAATSLVLTAPSTEAERPLVWRLTEESGRVVDGVLDPGEYEVHEHRELDGEQWIRATFTIPSPGSPGYHRFHLYKEWGSGDPLAQCLVISAPFRCYRPTAVDEHGRLWGLTAQLYGLRSQRNWGIGDFTDLIRLVEFAAANGAAFVGLNPLHSPLSHTNDHASPYDPSSRKFLNVLYLDVEAIPDFPECDEARQCVSDERFQAELRGLRAAELLDYHAVGAAKARILQLLFAGFCRRHRDQDTERGRLFRAFCQERGESLNRYAAFQVLYEHWREQNPEAWGWPAWPREFKDCRSGAVAGYLSSCRDRLDYFRYLQWNADQQLAAAGDRARELGMEIGIYADLALSSKHGGADTWVDRDLYLEGAHIGAPPDDFNQAGQDWGLPPWNPAKLRIAGYRPFIETLRANMRIGGALRIDHVMSLMRCFLLPSGGSATDGTYVHYRFDEMRAILALESQRHHCLVIGEDLGTVPDEVRRGLSESGVLGYRVLYFEKVEDGAFRSPADFDADVLSVISTHDLPTLTGFWQGADIEWRTEQDLFPTAEDRERQLVSRASDRARLLVALEKEQLMPAETAPTESSAGAEMTPGLRAAFHRYLARSASVLVGVQAEDLLGERGQANLPGTTSEHPNWRRRLSLHLESWPRDQQVLTLLDAVREERPGTSAQQPAPLAQASPRASIPRATYRVQLHKGFRFADVEQLVPYLDALGISHVYCSPYLKARAGSKHGYDIIDHNSLNPEIGDRADFDRFCESLAAHGMGHILDMVPNHMAVTGRDQEWWLDVLENGAASRYADFFDIDWQPLKDELRGKVLLPVLGDHYGNVLDRRELTLEFDSGQGSFAVDYFEHRFPIDPREYPQVLAPDLERLRNRVPHGDSSVVLLESLVTAFGNLPARSCADEDGRRERARDQKLHQQRLAELVANAPDIGRYVNECLRAFNGGEQYSPDIMRLHLLLEAQAYRLAYWRVASHEINYRRFFDINELASLRMENPEVFEATHKLVFELISTGKLQGLRIDHPDGLYDPRKYFRAVQERAGAPPAEEGGEAKELPLYLVAEKILAGTEALRDDWPIHGTTGYEFANLVNRYFVSPNGLDELQATYTDFIGRSDTYEEILHRCKTLIMQTSLASELNVLSAELDRLAEEDPHTRDFGLGGLRNALLEAVVCFPVYRTYSVDGEVSSEDKAIVDHAIDAAKRLGEASDTSVFDFLRDVLLNRSAIGRNAELQARVARFGMKLQQYTSPVAAKGMEDTAFYRYARLLSLNEVGGTPQQSAVSTAEFHEANMERLARWPHSMLASSTHDTKRSEDVRARLHVLSEIPGEWRQHVEHWTRINEPLKLDGTGVRRIERNTEYFLYQTLVGAWPLEISKNPENPEREQFAGRIADYMVKAVREAKQRTSWLNQDPDYEEGLQRFIADLLEPASNALFMEDFLPFQRRIARLGLYNGLSQELLKLTCPGVPDLYQGSELWRFDLVDPDNRRPVDFDRRRRVLDDLADNFRQGRREDLAASLMTTLEDGRAKLFVTWRALSVRRDYPSLFERGTYVPLAVGGERAAHVCAFARIADGVTLVVAALKGFAGLVDHGSNVEAARLAGTSIELPGGNHSFVDAFTNEPVEEDGEARALASRMFADLPVALWVGVGN